MSVRNILSSIGLLSPRSSRARRIRSLPDRRMMETAFIPALAAEGGRILWVGVREYTLDDYALLEAGGGEVWTTDIDPKADRWGRRGRHRTGDVGAADALFADQVFDTVVCNGVLGYGVDEPGHQARTFRALAALIPPQGRLLLGWNTDKIADPLAAGLHRPWFEAEPFAGKDARTTFAEVTHVYDSLRRTDAAVGPAA
jgi:hypothetical protein